MRCCVYCRVAGNLDLDATNQILPRGHAIELTRVKAQADQSSVWIAELIINNLSVRVEKCLTRATCAGFIVTHPDHSDVNGKSSAQCDHVITLIPCAAFATDSVINYVVEATTVVLNLDFYPYRMTDNVAIIFNDAQRRN